MLEYGEATIAEVKVSVKEINSIIKSEEINLKVYSGQEVYFTEKIIQDYIEGNIGTINDSRYMLLNFQWINLMKIYLIYFMNFKLEILYQ